MENIFIGLFVGVIFAYFLVSRLGLLKNKKKTQSQAKVLMESIKTVSKLITVEADFAEIYHYQSKDYKWLETIIGSKKAIILIDAKAHAGFDLSKINMEANTKKKVITLSNFPQPEILSIETDFKYYDKKEGWLNPLTSSDLTDITKEAKQHIINKIPESGVLQKASNRAIETIQLVEKLATTINWKIDYSALLLQEPSQSKKLHQHEN
ncbi:MAG: DUF4230 domain-containing protein [Flavobacteriales bacterium]